MLNVKTVIGGVIIFLAGAVAGYAIDYKRSLDRVTEMVDQASKELREMYEKKEYDEKGDPAHVVVTVASAENEKITGDNYTIYTNLSNGYSPKQESPIDESVRVIAPTEVGLIDSYDIETINIYSSGEILDDLDQPVECLEDHIGDALDHVGEYSPDCVYVANDDEKVYYEVLIINSEYMS